LQQIRPCLLPSQAQNRAYTIIQNDKLLFLKRALEKELDGSRGRRKVSEWTAKEMA